MTVNASSPFGEGRFATAKGTYFIVPGSPPNLRLMQQSPHLHLAHERLSLQSSIAFEGAEDSFDAVPPAGIQYEWAVKSGMVLLGFDWGF